MAILPRVFLNPAPIESGIQRVVEALSPDVVRIRYSLGDDWTGDPSVFFKIVLSDEASDDERLGETVERVTTRIASEVSPDELGIHAYFNFRGLSELLDLKDRAWM